MYRFLLITLIALSPSIAAALDCKIYPMGERIDEMVRNADDPEDVSSSIHRGTWFAIGYGTLSAPEIVDCGEKDWTGKTICMADQSLTGELMTTRSIGQVENMPFRTIMYEGAETWDAPFRDIWWPQSDSPRLYLFWATEIWSELSYIDDCVSGALMGPSSQQKQPIEHTLKALRNCMRARRCSREDIRVLNMAGHMF